MKDNDIHIKIGISYGNVTKLSPDEKDSHPWGYEMIMAKRIADLAKPGHILLDCSAKNNIQQYKRKYYENLIYVGTFPFKHRQKEPIFSYYKKDDFGNSTRPIDRTKSFLNVSLKLKLSIISDEIIHIKREHLIKNISCSPQELRKHFIPEGASNIELYDENKKPMKRLEIPKNLSNPQNNEYETLVFLNPLLEEGKSKIYTFEFDYNNTRTYDQLFTFDSEVFEAIIEYHGPDSPLIEFAEIIKEDGIVSERIEPSNPLIITDNDGGSITQLKYYISNIFSSETRSVKIRW
jgi:hypothetical protein